MKEFDLVIIGGGLAGIVTALELLDQGRSVVLVEQVLRAERDAGRTETALHPVGGDDAASDLLALVRGQDPVAVEILDDDRPHRGVVAGPGRVRSRLPLEGLAGVEVVRREDEEVLCLLVDVAGLDRQILAQLALNRDVELVD